MAPALGEHLRSFINTAVPAASPRRIANKSRGAAFSILRRSATTDNPAMDARLASPAAAASATLAILLLHVLASPATMAEAALGVNWGTITYHRLPPKTVASLLADNGIKKVKLFDVDSYTMETLAGTGIEVMIAVNNLLLEPMNDYQTAKAWVRANVTHYLTSTPKVNIK
ncbi:hypothetical protein HPP92_005503 [Vanilla planifolia]|uniref:Glucan endo-1,3-beta-D-glucosidase n=1 Tax=Vanilla planifolia TaxID=51239 RepID=A0A835RMT9_VANPL|nr:hypothetical protein HPP92_005503 [Vanilla planifolia]